MTDEDIVADINERARYQKWPTDQHLTPAAQAQYLQGRYDGLAEGYKIGYADGMDEARYQKWPTDLTPAALRTKGGRALAQASTGEDGCITPDDWFGWIVETEDEAFAQGQAEARASAEAESLTGIVELRRLLIAALEGQRTVQWRHDAYEALAATPAEPHE